MPEFNTENIIDSLKKLVDMVDEIYFVRPPKVITFKDGEKMVPTIEKTIQLWSDFLSFNSAIIEHDPSIFLDFAEFMLLIKFAASLAIVVRFVDDSNLFTISFVLNELAETLREPVKRGTTISIQFMHPDNLIRLRHEFYEFLRKTIGVHASVKYASKIFAFDHKNKIDDWDRLIDEISRDTQKILGKFIARGVKKSLKSIVTKYYKVIEL